MGVLAPGSAHARPSARPPIDTSGNCSAHLSGEGQGATFQAIGPSGVRALPLAAGISKIGHYFRYFSSFYLVIVLLSYLVTTAIQNHIRGCCRVPKFCMGF